MPSVRQQSRASTAPKTQATAGPASNSPAEKVAVSKEAAQSKPADEAAAQSKAQGLLGNMWDGLKNLSNAGKSFEFDDKEREKASAGLSALKKMAGEDGVLTPADRGNIIGQMDSAITSEKNKTVSRIADGKIQEAKNNRGPLRKALFPNAPLVSKVGGRKKQEALNDPQHMATARNQALGELNQGFKEMGMKTEAPVSIGQGLQNARQMPSISLEDTNAFKDTMLMVREKAKAMGLPEGKFKEGLPVAFLQDVLDGKPAASLLKHQVNPFGK
ncbi:MAG: hypothetical protein WC314_03140 [Vulcanimicrobiota bacterium]